MSENEKLNADEIRELVKTLKDLALELRGALDELTNPVITRVPRPAGPGAVAEASQGEAAPETQASQASGAEAPAASVPAESGGEAAGTEAGGLAGGRAAAETRASIAEAGGGALQTPPLAPRVERPRGPRFTLEKVAGLIRLMYELASRAPPEYLEGLIDTLYTTGLISEVERDTVKKVLEIARIGLEHGLGAHETIAILAAISRELGLDVSDITSELVKTLIRRRGGADWASQQ